MRDLRHWPKCWLAGRRLDRREPDHGGGSSLGRRDRSRAERSSRPTPRSDWRSSPSSSRPRSRTPRAGPSSPLRADGSSPPRTRLAGRSSATFTTARSSGSSRSDWRCALRRRASLPSGTTSAPQLSGVATGLVAAVEDLQEISRGIHPAILSKGGLAPALQALAHRSAIPVDLEITADVRLAEPIEVAAYFVASEALANAAKHSQASRIDVSLEQRDGSLVLSVRDDGVGGADASRGLGSRRPHRPRRGARRDDLDCQPTARRHHTLRPPACDDLAAPSHRETRSRSRRAGEPGREGYHRKGHAVAVAGCRSGDGSAEARSRAAEKLGASARRRRARPRAPTRSHSRTATDDRRVVAALACHGPRSDRPAGPDRGRRVGGARALVRASARVAHPRPHGAAPEGGRGVAKHGRRDRCVGARPAQSGRRVAEGACRRDESRRGRAVQRGSRRHERDRDCAGRRPRLPGVRLRALQRTPSPVGLLRRSGARPGVRPRRSD